MRIAIFPYASLALVAIACGDSAGAVPNGNGEIVLALERRMPDGRLFSFSVAANGNALLITELWAGLELPCDVDAGPRLALEIRQAELAEVVAPLVLLDPTEPLFDLPSDECAPESEQLVLLYDLLFGAWDAGSPPAPQIETFLERVHPLWNRTATDGRPLTPEDARKLEEGRWPDPVWN